MSIRLRKWEASRLRSLIRSRTPDSSIYKLLRDELKSLGHWKQKPRGRHVRRKRMV